MDTMTTTQHLGQAPGRARRCASTLAAWAGCRQHWIAPAVDGASTTGVPGSEMNAYLGNTTTLAGAKNETFIKRHARHLETGST